MDWGSFLGTGRKALRNLAPIVPYEEAMIRVRAAGITTVEAYSKWQPRPPGMPFHPHRTYRRVWIGYGEFFGTGRRPRTTKVAFVAYAVASSFAQRAGITSRADYKAWDPKPPGVPHSPESVYEDEWQSWGSFLNTGRRPQRRLMTYLEAQHQAQSAGITSAQAYREWTKPEGMPSNPNRAYLNEWRGWGHFLGTKRSFRKTTLSYSEASSRARAAGIETAAQYSLIAATDPNLPRWPERVYGAEWRGWRGFLGTGGDKRRKNGRRTVFVSYAKASNWAKKNHITSAAAYFVASRPDGVPYDPVRAYETQWISWGEFLGTGRTAPQTEFLSFAAVRDIARAAGIKTSTEYRSWNPKPAGIPSNPNYAYPENWDGWPSFLGTKAA